MPDFKFHKMNDVGMERSKKIAELFEKLSDDLESHLSDVRCARIAATKLEEACFFVKKSMALNTDNQDNG